MPTAAVRQSSSAPAALLVTLVLPLAAGQGTPPREDVILRAMHDELERARELTVETLESPYYVEYALHDGETLIIDASLGALAGVRQARFRQPTVQVRVGSPQFDNTNHVLSDYMFGARYDAGQTPLDNSYDLLRRYFWLATDRAYKSALEVIARKRAALRNFNSGEQPPDFAKAEPSKIILRVETEQLDVESWKARLRSLSAVFTGYPAVVSSGVQLQANQGAFYFANSEGAEVRIPETLIFLEVRARALAPDGMMLRDSMVFQSRSVSGLPTDAEMQRGIEEVGDSLKALIEAAPANTYTGPVLFEARAAAQMFAEVLGRSLGLRRKPVSEPGRPLPSPPNELEGRIGSQILPSWMDVVDDPAQAEWRGRPLFGHYLVDLEGVTPKPLSLVEKGVLKTYLLTRQPVGGFSESNGRARLPGGFGVKAPGFGNLFVRASQTVAQAELKRQMLELCRLRDKPYGILIRKMDFPSSASLEEFRRLAPRMSQVASGARPVSLPVLVYRVYPDGREELVRGLRFRDLAVRSLRDIVAASDEHHVFEFLDNNAPFALMGAGGFAAESAVVAPAVLFDELQLDRAEEQIPKPPVVPPPPLSGTR